MTIAQQGLCRAAGNGTRQAHPSIAAQYTIPVDGNTQLMSYGAFVACEKTIRNTSLKHSYCEVQVSRVKGEMTSL